ncbi:MAG TPA: OmpH family outer membrane protein [Pirellulales bacterium]|nr:OmpH family outer membrane protein [Pirellulales bacterium]
MKIHRVLVRISAVLAVASLAGGAALFLAAPARGQGGAPNAQNIAVIDIGKILKNDTKFKQEMSNLQAEVIATEKQLRNEANEIQNLMNQQKTFAAGTPDFVRLDTEITKRSADLNVQKSLKNKEFVERQSKMLFAAYRDIQDAVKEFSSRYNIGLVVQYDSSPIDNSDPQAILSGAHRSVVFVNPGLDITGDILASLNRSAQHAASTAPIGVGVPAGSGQYPPR